MEPEKQPIQPPANEKSSKQRDDDFVASYAAAKQKEVEKLSQEIEQRNADDNKRKRRKWWIKTILLLVLIAASIALLFGITDLIAGESMHSLQRMVSNISWNYFALLIGVVLLYILLESAKYSYLLKISTGKFRFRNSVKVMFLGKYYDGITPLGTGGQPFQIYYLHKKDIPAGVATAVPLVKYIVSTIVVCLVAAVFFGIAPAVLPVGWGSTTLLVIAWLSMLGNLLIPVAMLLASLFPRAGKKFTVKLVGLLNRMHLVKHKYPTMRKYIYEIDEYRASLKAIIRRWWLILPLVVICILDVFVSFSLPFFVMLALARYIVVPTTAMFFEMLLLSLIAFYSASLVPTPGNSGALETTTSIIFATVLVKYTGLSPLIGWIVLVWRLFSYYLYILSGIGINIFEIIRGAVRRRAKRGDA